MYRTHYWLKIVVVILALAVSSIPAAAQAPQERRPEQRLTPVVFFPGWSATRLEVRVHNEAIAPECPASGTFEYTYLAPGSDFSQTCQDKLLTLAYKFGPGEPAGVRGKPPWTISEQRGVRVMIMDYGRTESSPGYESLYAFLEQAGYERNVNIRVAGYDFRLTPDMGGFMERTIELIEETYRDNGNTPVHLVAHSGGPLYAQYLLTHTSQQWKNKYIQGFTPIAGCWPGQGWSYTILFTGFNIPSGGLPTDTAQAATSAAMYASHPSSYMIASDPAYFGDREVVIRVGPEGKEYTPQDALQLFRDAGLTLAEKIAPYYFGLVKFLPPYFPNVDVYAEKGSGFATLVGLQVPDLTPGQVVTDATAWIMQGGDGNQEDITNEAVQAWQAMPCYHFELNDNPGVDHFTLPGDPAVLGRLLAHAQLPRSECRNR
jgi:lecithin-cholesterol acyltransferase